MLVRVANKHRWNYSSLLIDILLFQHVGWWSPTIIRGEDREAVHIPNHKFTVNVVRNLTQKTHWRIKTHLAISHLDVNKINVRKKSHICLSINMHMSSRR